MTTITASAVRPDCTPAERVTRSLLGYGIIAGPMYVLVSLAQAVTRDGFDLRRHEWSLLANGEHGWIQSANLAITGLMIIAAAVGLRRSLDAGPGALWGPRLVAGYGVGLVAAGTFRADPALGFPVGTPEGPGVISWHGLAHFAAAGLGFACLGAACFVLARRFAAENRPRWVATSRLVGVVFLTGFAAVASTGGSVAANLAFTAAVIMVCGWVTAVSIDRFAR
jgi:hypothetical membrane protein